MIEKRQHPRKIFQTKAQVFLGDNRAYDAKSVDLSVGGICLLIPGKNLRLGQQCELRFTLTARGRLHKINVIGKVVYSICTSEGFKIGFQFVNLDAGCTAAIEAYMI